MTNRKAHRRVTSAVVLIALASGCGGETIPAAADPSRARAAVTQALEAWKRGEKPAELKTRSPEIQVADEDWLQGYRLESYQLGPAETIRGLSLQCPVILSLKGKNGRRMTKRVTYGVATDPVLSVIRQEAN